MDGTRHQVPTLDDNFYLDLVEQTFFNKALLNVRNNDLSLTILNSLRTLGCVPCGPGDLPIFIFLRH